MQLVADVPLPGTSLEIVVGILAVVYLKWARCRRRVWSLDRPVSDLAAQTNRNYNWIGNLALAHGASCRVSVQPQYRFGHPPPSWWMIA